MAQSSRVLRLLALAGVVGMAYFAQYLFEFGTLANLYPTWMLERLPFLQRTTLWLPDDLYTLGIWLLGGAALLFGLLVPGWEEQPALRWPPAVHGASLEAAGSKVAGAETGGSEPAQTSGPAFLWLGLILAAAGAFVAWGWTELPVRIDPQVARSGLQAQALLAGTGGGWLSPGATGAPQIAYFPSALAALLAGSGLGGAHLVGLLAALLTVVGTYLLAVELFWLSPQRVGLAVLAAGFTGGTVALFHFGRLAPFLPATAAGTLGAWALLRGQRTAHPALVAAGGVLAAAALWFDRSGLIFFPVLLLWSLGLRLQGGGSGRLFVLWLAGYLVFAAPLLVVFLLNPGALWAYLQGGPAQGVLLGDWWRNLQATVTTIFWTPDASGIFGYGGHFLAGVVAPLFVLGTGALLLNLDRQIGWCLLTALGGVLLLGSALSPVAPFWPLLLPLLPFVGITIAFALERLGAAWAAASHEAGSTAAASLAGGLLIAAAVISWIGYYEYAAVGSVGSFGGDGPSFTGRALATLPPEAVAVLVAATPETNVALDDPVVQFVAGPRANQALAVGIDALPATLPPGSRIIVQGNDAVALSAARARYPAAVLHVTRDGNANPRLFVLQLP
jgi:hypothetical protein